MSKSYDVLVYIGRLQVPHRGHEHIIETALSQSHRVLLLLGSANSARNLRNPFTFEERAAMIEARFPNNTSLCIQPLDDYPYNDDAWMHQVQQRVHQYLGTLADTGSRTKVGLIGYGKDSSSYYLNMFPQWGSISAEPISHRGVVISSTEIRKVLFDPNGLHGTRDLETYCSPQVVDWISQNLPNLVDTARDQKVWQLLRDENRYITRYRESWEPAPYKPTFVTVDAVVVQSGHVLLVRRKAEPGRGLLALPGGFVDQNERLLDAAIRELREETRLRVPVPVLRGSLGDRERPQLLAQRVFDDPYRSLRGRTITTAFYFRLTDQPELPAVKGGDDASEAIWYPLANIRAHEMYEDHYHIIHAMTGGAL